MLHFLNVVSCISQIPSTLFLSISAARWKGGMKGEAGYKISWWISLERANRLLYYIECKHGCINLNILERGDRKQTFKMLLHQIRSKGVCKQRGVLAHAQDWNWTKINAIMRFTSFELRKRVSLFQQSVWGQLLMERPSFV